MCNSNDTNDVCIAAKDERMREALQWKTAMSRIQFLAKRWKLDEYSLQQELIAQSFELGLIVLGCQCA